MNFTAAISGTVCRYSFSFFNGTSMEYELEYVSVEARDFKIDETRYIWLQRNLEMVVNNIRFLASEKLQNHYNKLTEEIRIVQELKMEYKPGTHSSVLIAKISDKAHIFRSLIPPETSKYHNRIKSQITSLLLYCDIN